MIRAFDVNPIGKDFICSDIHGYFSVLERQLISVGFDESCDRLFSLGDMIDRGDESNKVLDWLAKPWFYAIQGNHERMLINSFKCESDFPRHQWLLSGGEWAKDLSSDKMELFYNVLSKLPIAIELSLPRQYKIGLVHAELPDQCDWNDVEHTLKTISPSSAESNRLVGGMLWKRRQPHLPVDKISRIENVDNIDHVFHGHTILSDYLTLANRTFMDLGSYRTGRIGLLNPLQWLMKP